MARSATVEIKIADLPEVKEAMAKAADEIARLRALCIAHEVDPEGCLECFMADVEKREPAPLPHGIEPWPTEQSGESGAPR